MLQELEDGVKQLLCPTHTCSQNVLLHTWHARSQLLQVYEPTHSYSMLTLSVCVSKSYSS